MNPALRFCCFGNESSKTNKNKEAANEKELAIKNDIDLKSLYPDFVFKNKIINEKLKWIFSVS